MKMCDLRFNETIVVCISASSWQGLFSKKYHNVIYEFDHLESNVNKPREVTLMCRLLKTVSQSTIMLINKNKTS